MQYMIVPVGQSGLASRIPAQHDKKNHMGQQASSHSLASQTPTKHVNDLKRALEVLLAREGRAVRGPDSAVWKSIFFGDGPKLVVLRHLPGQLDCITRILLQRLGETNNK